MSEFGPTMSRTIEEVRGIGFGDKVAEAVPSITPMATSSFNRTLLYQCNMWQATGYAGGVDGPVRSLAHHRWPFDIEMQLVFSTLADWDVGTANIGAGGADFTGGVKQVQYGQVTNDLKKANTQGGNPGTNPGHRAIITICEACWFNSWSVSFTKDAGAIMENGQITITDMHDYASMYGEFLATGNDPTIGQQGSIRFQAANLGVGSLAGQSNTVTVTA